MYRLIIGLACALLGTVAVPAADGATPIWQPTVITDPGQYVVTRNILNTSDTSPLLVIAASNVEIDLNGFTLMQDGHVPVVLAENVQGVTVLNGTLVADQHDGLRFAGVQRFILRHLTVTKPPGNETGIYLSGCEMGVIEDTVVDGSFEMALVIAGGQGIQVRRSRFRQTDCEAAVAVGGNYCTFENNSLFVCSRLKVSGNGNLISGNDIRSVLVEPGIHVTGSRNRIENNTLIDNLQGGLRLEGSDNFYDGNLARGNSGMVCPNPAGTADFCDTGTNNTSGGNNFMPGRM